ncbi:uncharacterized protein LOC101718151 isoform X2 [Heterocephalus glaber]|uniref:Uncharacterized protein LOC101718151 isoform X2 n=1 Tax=Heterocephalus glaber TaxID=10181 RepID=A0AAX6RA78_HETGA|nr:uncharacterized protein LOC101718151 isoform X2 [Heterocephalus glaber]
MVIVGLPGEDYPGCSSSCLKPVVSEHRCLSMWCPRDTHVQHSSVHHRKIHRIFSKEYTLGKKLDIAQIEGFMNGGWKFCISSSDFSNNEAQLRVCQDWFPNFLPWLYISSITRKKNIFSQVMDSPLLRHKSCNLQLPDKDCCSRRMCFTRLQIVTVSNPGTSAAPLTGSKDLLLTDDPLTISP